jgi:hypothetical protein
MGIPPKVFNSIVNKTAISYKANRMIGGREPSKYLAQIQQHSQVQLGDASMNGVVASHLIDPTELRDDRFEQFYQARKAALLPLVSAAMGKAVSPASEIVPEDVEDEERKTRTARIRSRKTWLQRMIARVLSSSLRSC